MTTKLQIELNVSDQVLAYLKKEAGRRRIPIDVVISEVVEDYFEDPTDEQILASLKQGMQQALAGNVRSAHEVLDELENE